MPDVASGRLTCGWRWLIERHQQEVRRTTYGRLVRAGDRGCVRDARLADLVTLVDLGWTRRYLIQAGRDNRRVSRYSSQLLRTLGE